ncbi:MAG TPA: hypothetical protein VKB88_38895 [Bryobacteraceae bacterium]|nr:hypothetical protein [Bryobacteraceae bacterium]
MELPWARKPTSAELVRAFACAAVLLWVNLYIARDFFSAHTAYMNSMHGFWAAMAKRAGAGWWRPMWWPYWDCGIPFEAAYAPLVPGLTALWAALGRISHDQAFGCVTGFFYCLGPLALFAMAWGITRAAGASFFAGLFYSLTSVTQWAAPDGQFHLDKIFEARRLFLASAWDETPHMSAVSLLPLAILFLALAIDRRRKRWYAAAALTIALMTVTSAFGAVAAGMAAACLLFVLRRERWAANTLLVACIGVYAYLMAMAWVPPSVLRAIRESAVASDQERWTLGTVTAAAILILGWSILWPLLQRWTRDWQLQFFALFAWLLFSLPFTGEMLHRPLMPQPGRYKLELEMALALALVFGAAELLKKVPVGIRRALVFLAVALTVEQIANFRKLEKMYLFPKEETQTVEYRAAVWVASNLPGKRVFFPGSMAQWANDFAGVLQFSGGSWSMATNQSQQNAQADIVFGGGPGIREISINWLKAFGVSAVAMSGPNSQEYWHPYADPKKFEGLPVLWADSGITIYQVPSRSDSLAHVVPSQAIVARPPRNPEDGAQAARFAAALDDASLPLASLTWQGTNHIRIHTTAAPGQAISVQVGYHPGWYATVNGQRRAIYKDGLGLMWLRPECNGTCEIAMDYDGGWGLWLCRVLSYASILGLAGLAAFGLSKRPSHSRATAAGMDGPHPQLVR